jgi:alkaline phosphatase
VAALSAALTLTACGGGGELTYEGPPTLVAAGDIVECDLEEDEATAEVVERLDPDVVAPLGDLVYETGSPREFDECYEPSWGRFKGRTRPAIGNHEILGNPHARGYFGYFGRRAHPPDAHYAYDLGSWRVIVLDSNACEVEGCGAGSAQVRWLRRELERSRARCTLAYWHHPRFSSGVEHGSHPSMETIWATLARAGAEVVLSAHEHNYERFEPQDATGRPDRRGIREFVVGTGGAGLYPFGKPIRNSEARGAEAHGVLELELEQGAYRWRFHSAPEGAYEDSGEGRCS